MNGHSTRIKYKIVLLGDQGVGKTALIDRYIHNIFNPSYNATIGVDFLIKNADYHDKHYRLHLWDTAGQQRFRSLVTNYLKDSHCSLILYDATNPQSLTNAVKWLEIYNQFKRQEAVSYLIGNKIDLKDSVKTKGLQAKTQKLKELFHFRVSAKDGEGVQQLFKEITLDLDRLNLAIRLKLIPSTATETDQSVNPEKLMTFKALINEREAQRVQLERSNHAKEEQKQKKNKRFCCF